MVRFRVKELARSRGITSEELALQSGVKISTVRNIWQNRVSDPSFSTMDALARALGVSIEELVDRNSVADVEATQKNEAPAGFGVSLVTA